jgi:hypothetical protein
LIQSPLPASVFSNPIRLNRREAIQGLTSESQERWFGQQGKEEVQGKEEIRSRGTTAT